MKPLSNLTGVEVGIANSTGNIKSEALGLVIKLRTEVSVYCHCISLSVFVTEMF